MINTILVVVPHEDDEINLAGATIYKAKQEKRRVICVFVTNGDWLYSADIRMKEALQSLRILGVPEEDTIFLGYPDGGTHAERSIFMHGKDNVLNANGRTHTYGSQYKKDFATEEYGHPHAYRWENLLMDLKNIILKYKPEMIIGTDFDNHPDHRMCSIALDTAMGHILNKKGNNYFPIYLKGFAYSTAFEGKDDFFTSVNIQSTKINEEALTYPEFGIDNPAFEWDKRVRFPVPEACRTIDLKRNVIYRALCSYVSQRIFVRASRIINGDQVFWQRRTDNLAHQGQITVSSGHGEYLHDFQTMYANDISVKKPVFNNYAWQPEEQDKEKWCRCTFSSPQHIETISFWGNIELENQILRGVLRFSNGYQCEVGPFLQKGRETKVKIPVQENVQWIEFKILQWKGAHPGIAEWGIYPKQEKKLQLLHILCNGELAYDWTIWPGEKVPEITAYFYGISSPLQWFFNGKEKKSVAELNKCCTQHVGPNVIRVEVAGDSQLYDEIRITYGTVWQQWKYRWQLFYNRQFITWMKLKGARAHHRLKKAVKRGLFQS